jgi:hypothetical protein
MFPVASTAGGNAFGFPDVCLTPPPIPYPNTGMLQLTVATAPTVFIQNMPVVILTSVIPVSVGDQPGILHGVVSHKTMGTVRFVLGSTKVFASGLPVIYLGSLTTHNGDPPNVPGAVVLVAQTTVFTAP